MSKHKTSVAPLDFPRGRGQTLGMSRGTVILLAIMGSMVAVHIVLWVCVIMLMKRRLLARSLLFVMFLFLPFTFPMAWIWRHQSNAPGPGPAVLHVCSSVWLGFVLNFCMCLAVALPVAGVARLFKRRFGAKPLLRTVFCVAFAVTLFGMINARFPRLREIEVEIRDLPENWHGKTIVQLTDVHLGMVQGNGLLRRVAKQVDEVGPEFVVITGDLFDGLVVDCHAYVDGLNEIRARKGVFYVSGNHEGYHSVEEAKAALERTHIRVLDDEIVEVDGLQLVGASYPEYRLIRTTGKPPFTGAGCRKDIPAILLYHTPTGLGSNYGDRYSQQMRTYFFPETGFELAREMGIDLQLSGHTHGGQTFPFGIVAGFIFHGLHRGLHRFGDFSIYISPGVGTWGPPMRIGQNPEITVIRLLPTSGE